MRFSERRIVGSSGEQLYIRHWEPEQQELQAVVCIIHGMGEHSGRYMHVAELITEQGMAVMAMDQQGHGRSGGKRGHMQSLESAIEDAAKLIDEAAGQYAGVPVFLYGHSMGGNVVLNCALRLKPRIKGLIVSSPWLRLAFAPPAVKEWLGRAASTLAPRLHQQTGLKSGDLFRPGYAKAPSIEGDALNHTHITPRTYFSVRVGGEWALMHAGGNLNVPMLLLHGTDDRITSYAASKSLAESIGSGCTWRSWEGGFHELHNDLEGEAIILEIIEWIKGQL